MSGLRRCEWCGTQMIGRRSDARFCGRDCQVRSLNREPHRSFQRRPRRRRSWKPAVTAVFAARLTDHIKTRELRRRYEDLTRVYEEPGR